MVRKARRMIVLYTYKGSQAKKIKVFRIFGLEVLKIESPKSLLRIGNINILPPERAFYNFPFLRYNSFRNQDRKKN